MKETISFRCGKKTKERINSIRKQLIEKGFEEEDLTDGFIIREAISLLDEKAKYFIWEIEKK